jgi:hypothetical protein
MSDSVVLKELLAVVGGQNHETALEQTFFIESIQQTSEPAVGVDEFRNVEGAYRGSQPVVPTRKVPARDCGLCASSVEYRGVG